jgi:hypothetical protein
MKSKDFTDFFNKASKMLEKELDCYIIRDNIDEFINNDYESSNMNGNNEILNKIAKYVDSHYT